MITNLKQDISELRANRLINYGNTAYQRISHDWYFENVPDELLECWYGEGVSFVGLIDDYKKDINEMTEVELTHLYLMEDWLNRRLKKIFLQLKEHNGGKFNG
ncbi:hypothetical protein ACTGZQ_01205 [Streptococcus suis]